MLAADSLYVGERYSHAGRARSCRPALNSLAQVSENQSSCLGARLDEFPDQLEDPLVIHRTSMRRSTYWDLPPRPMTRETLFITCAFQIREPSRNGLQPLQRRVGRHGEVVKREALNPDFQPAADLVPKHLDIAVMICPDGLQHL